MKKAALLVLLPLCLQLGACSTVQPMFDSVTDSVGKAFGGVDKVFGDATPGVTYDQAAADCGKDASSGLDANEKFGACMRAKGWTPR